MDFPEGFNVKAPGDSEIPFGAEFTLLSQEENMGRSFQKCHYGGHFFQVIVEDMVFDKPEQIIP